MSSTTPPEALRRIEECRKNKKRSLDLSSLALSEIPSEIADLVWLKTLIVSRNEISGIKNLDQLTALTVLNLWNNQISEIKNLDQLTGLTELYLSHNEISEIKNLDQLTALTTLYLSENQISEIKNLNQLSTLAELYLSDNEISEIKNLDQLIALTTLDLFLNQISEIKNLDQLSALTTLYLSENQISEIKNLDKLAALAVLDLFFNQISEIKNLDELSALTVLNLWGNRISEIKNLDKLSTLSVLDISENQISKIKNLDQLSALTVLKLWGNQISKIENLDQLTALNTLELSGNQISSLAGLPNKLLEKLIRIDLLDNPIEGTTITDWKNPKAILGYIESQQDNQVTNYHLKINIIGEGRIGKTQLFNFWKKRKRYKPNDKPTHGTLTTQYDLPGSEYKATIWDFGGQAYHHGFHHVFLRPNDFYLVLWRNKEGRKDYGYWLGTARNFSRPSQKEYTAPVVLVQNVWNETDKPEAQTTHTADLIDFPDSQKMAKYRVKLDHVFVIDVNYLHQKNLDWKARHEYFTRSLYRMMEAHTKKLLPTISEKWLRVKEQLDKVPIEEINLTKAKFREQHAPDFDEAALAGLLDYLEFTGNIIKFPESSYLTDYVFPNPPFLADWIYNKVLRKESEQVEKGILNYTELEGRIGKEKANIFLEIMEEFHLLFPEKGEGDNLIVPQFLPENNNTFKRLILELIPYSFCLRFDDYFHESRIFQFISEYSEYADDNTSYWRYGLVFTIDDINALVYYNKDRRTLFVHLENKKGRIQLAQELFNFFSYVEVSILKSSEKLQLLRNSLYERQLSTIIRYRANSNIKGPIDSTTLEQSVNWELAKRKIRPFARQEFKNHVREKVNPDDLIEGAQLSINRKHYIDIKETLRSNAEEINIGIDVKSRQRIKLDSLILNLLGLMNQKLPKVFISYSRKDLEFKNELKNYLSSLEAYDLIDAWSCEEIQAGTWDSQIQTELEEANIIVYMVSQNFMASGYIMEQEVAKGIKMAQENPDKKIICVLVRNCPWKSWSLMEEKFKEVLDKSEKEVFSKNLSDYQFLPYHQYKNQEGVPVREEIVALEQWGRYPYDVPSVAYMQVVEQILAEATRKK